MTSRRSFITLLGGAAAAWPVAARAQQTKMPVIGFLHQGSPDTYTQTVAGFRQGLKDGGLVEGENFAIEFRWADNHYERLPELAADLVSRRVTVISAALLPAAQAAKSATNTIPIVFSIGSDPVGVGLVSSYSRPQGNLTGLTQLQVALVAKRIEILHEAVPTARTIALLVNPTNPNADTVKKEAIEAANTLSLEIKIFSASTGVDIDAAFTSIVRERIGGLVSAGDAFLVSQGDRVIAMAAQHSIPVIFNQRDLALRGGLMSYGADSSDAYKLWGAYTARILKGAKAADLPVLQATKVKLALNLKTAKTLGISIPLSLLGRADEVIE